MTPAILEKYIDTLLRNISDKELFLTTCYYGAIKLGYKSIEDIVDFAVTKSKIYYRYTSAFKEDSSTKASLFVNLIKAVSEFTEYRMRLDFIDNEEYMSEIKYSSLSDVEVVNMFIAEDEITEVFYFCEICKSWHPIDYMIFRPNYEDDVEVSKQDEFIDELLSTVTTNGQMCAKCFNTVHVCKECSTLDVEENMSTVNDDEWYCEDCANDIIPMCDMCESRDYGDSMRYVDELYLCESCYNDNVISCDNCGDEFIAGDSYEYEVTSSYGGTDFLCPTCVDEITVVCNDCEERHYDTDVHYVYGAYDDYYCNSCISNNSDFVTCDNCGAITDTSSSSECGDCGNSLDSNYGLVSYGFKPEPVFHRLDSEDSSVGCLGLELEVELNGADKHEIIEYIREQLDVQSDEMYFKNDGSLDDGLELITHPMSLGYHLNVFPWDEILDYLKSQGCRSHDTTTCGIHVHLGREYINSVGNIIWFTHAFWNSSLKFSRRNAERIREYAEPIDYIIENSECVSVGEAYDRAENFGRYTVVNVQNRSTAELRLFRGTLNIESLNALLVWSDLMYRVGNMSTDELFELEWNDFINLSDNRYWTNYLDRRGLLPTVVESEDNTSAIEDTVNGIEVI